MRDLTGREVVVEGSSYLTSREGAILYHDNEKKPENSRIEGDFNGRTDRAKESRRDTVYVNVLNLIRDSLHHRLHAAHHLRRRGLNKTEA